MFKHYSTILLAILSPLLPAQEIETLIEPDQATGALIEPDQATGANEPSPTGEETDDSWMTSSFNWLEEQRDLLSKRVTSTAATMDEYIARDSFDSSRMNESFLRIRISQSASTGYSFDTRVRIKARVDVPSSMDKVKIFFDTNPDEFDSIDARRRDNQDTGRLGTDDAVLGFSFFQEAKSTWNPNLKIGLSTSPTELYSKVRVRRYNELPGPWQSRFDQSFTYFDSRGWVTSTGYDAYRPLENRGIFRISSEAQFSQEEENPVIVEGEPPPSENFWEFYHGWSLYRQLDDDTSIEYNISATALSRPTPRMENIWASVEWRQLLYKDWLFAKVTPEISFPRERNFSATYSIYFELEIYVGEHFKTQKYEGL